MRKTGHVWQIVFVTFFLCSVRDKMVSICAHTPFFVHARNDILHTTRTRKAHTHTRAWRKCYACTQTRKHTYLIIDLSSSLLFFRIFWWHMLSVHTTLASISAHANNNSLLAKKYNIINNSSLAKKCNNPTSYEKYIFVSLSFRSSGDHLPAIYIGATSTDMERSDTWSITAVLCRLLWCNNIQNNEVR